MPFVPVAGTAGVEVRYDYFGQRVENTLYFLHDGLPTEAQLVELGNAMLVWATASLLPNLSQQISLREIYVTDLTSNVSPAITIPAPAPAPTGGVLIDGLPGNVALCVSFRTPFRGRRNRGRNYVCGLDEGAVSGNTVSASRAAFIRSAYNDLLGPDGLVTGWTWVVVHRFEGTVPLPAGVATEVTSVVITDLFVDSQRRRLTGRGT